MLMASKIRNTRKKFETGKYIHKLTFCAMLMYYKINLVIKYIYIHIYIYIWMFLKHYSENQIPGFRLLKCTRTKTSYENI